MPKRQQVYFFILNCNDSPSFKLTRWVVLLNTWFLPFMSLRNIICGDSCSRFSLKSPRISPNSNNYVKASSVMHFLYDVTTTLGTSKALCACIMTNKWILLIEWSILHLHVNVLVKWKKAEDGKVGQMRHCFLKSTCWDLWRRMQNLRIQHSSYIYITKNNRG